MSSTFLRILTFQVEILEDDYDLPTLDVALAGMPFAGNIRYFPSIHSTNALAMREAEEGAPEGMVYFADEQTRRARTRRA